MKWTFLKPKTEEPEKKNEEVKTMTEETNVETGRCFKCRAQKKMLAAVKERKVTSKRTVTLLVGTCETCGNKIYKLTKGDAL